MRIAYRALPVICLALSLLAVLQACTLGAGTHEVLFSDAAQGSWVTDPVDLDVAQVQAIQFQVPSVMGAEVPFDFCVEGLTALLE
jgi:hypothetical protein